MVKELGANGNESLHWTSFEDLLTPRQTEQQLAAPASRQPPPQADPELGGAAHRPYRYAERGVKLRALLGALRLTGAKDGSPRGGARLTRHSMERDSTDSTAPSYFVLYLNKRLLPALQPPPAPPHPAADGGGPPQARATARVVEHTTSLATELRQALGVGMVPLLIHERDVAAGAVEFDEIIRATPQDLLDLGLYKPIAIPWYRIRAYRQVATKLALLHFCSRATSLTADYLLRTSHSVSALLRYCFGACCLLPTAYCLLLTARCSLLAARCSLLATHYSLLTAGVGQACAGCAGCLPRQGGMVGGLLLEAA